MRLIPAAIGQLRIDHPALTVVPVSHPFAKRRRIPVVELEDQAWIAGAGGREDPQFGAWPTLVSPKISFTVRDWPTRLGFVEAGLGLTTIPGIASDSAPRDIRTVTVDDPSWRGRSVIVATRRDRSDAEQLVVDAIVRQSGPSHSGRPTS